MSSLFIKKLEITRTKVSKENLYSEQGQNAQPCLKQPCSLPDFPVGEGLGLDRDDVGVLLLAFRNFGLVGWHVELRWPLPTDDR